MPKDEFDFDDPLELTGVAMLTDEDTSGAMCECFIEEFMRMGYGHKQILAMFRNPHYLAMNMVVENKGEQFVRDQISDVFARWGRAVVWRTPVDPGSARVPRAIACGSPATSPVTSETEAARTTRRDAALSTREACAPQTEWQPIEFRPSPPPFDPLGNPAPDVTL